MVRRLSVGLSFQLLVLVPAVFSAHKCYDCRSTLDSQCGDTLHNGFPNQCVNNTKEEVSCMLYKYKINGENETHIFRGCKIKTDTCDVIKRSLELTHKEYIHCETCDEDLCNNVFTKKEKQNKEKEKTPVGENSPKSPENNSTISTFISWNISIVLLILIKQIFNF